jgi:putative transcriptional regulator
MTASEHHPSDALLARDAAGTLGDDFAIVVAAHLTFCPRCRERRTELEALGGALLDALPNETVPDGVRAAVFASLDETPSEETTPASLAAEGSAGGDLPTPVARLLDQPLDGLRWRSGGRGLRFASLGESRPGVRRLFVRAEPGASLPRHSHEGDELTIILSGAYNDGLATYRPGDFSEADADIDHRPKAEPGEICLCYIVTDAPFRLTGPIGRRVNRFVNF